MMSETLPATPLPTVIEQPRPPAIISSSKSETCDIQATSIKDIKGMEETIPESKWCPIPAVASELLNRKFEVDLPNIEITSLDMTPHGCFVVAGCSNGMVLLFDLTSSSKHGTLVGHIRAKGMHTNLILTVKITEDCRFAFAGCLKGSMEMLAVDMGQIPMWRQQDKPSTSSQLPAKASLRRMSPAPGSVRTYNYLDPKLRGFGAVSRLKPQKSGVKDEKYVLICGKGIKSVHVWLFTPATAPTTATISVSTTTSTSHPGMNKTIEVGGSVCAHTNKEMDGGPVWTFLFDVATNGVTIEALGFRFWYGSSAPEEEGEVMTVSSEEKTFVLCRSEQEKEEIEVTEEDIDKKQDIVKDSPMLQMLSKSRGMCVRVWNLVALDRNMTKEKETMTDLELGKLPFEDIPNSQDSRAFSDDGELAFGGLYNFSVLRLDAPKWANRESYEVPARCTEDDTGQRRRRMMREINEVIACHDGNHVLALCTDGGVLYYHYDGCTSSSTSSDGGGFGNLIEFQSLTREVEVGPEFMTDDSWAIKRVGLKGTVVVIRACKGLASKDEEGGGAIVEVSLLSDLAPEAFPILPVNESTGFIARNRGLCYHDDTQSKVLDALALTSPEVSPAPSSSSVLSVKPPSGRPRKKHKDKIRDKEKDKVKNKEGVERDIVDSGGLGPKEHKSHSSTPRDKKTKISASLSASKFSTPAETVRGVMNDPSSACSRGSSDSGGGKRQGNGVLQISPLDNMAGLGGGNRAVGGGVNKMLYAPTPNAKKRPISRKHEDSSDGDTSPRSSTTTVTLPATKVVERKSSRKRSLALQVDQDNHSGNQDKAFFNSDGSTGHDMSSMCFDGHSGDSYKQFMYTSLPQPLHIPPPGPAPRVKRVTIVPYNKPTQQASTSTSTHFGALHESSQIATNPSAVDYSATVQTTPLAPDSMKQSYIWLQHFQAMKEKSWIPLTTSSFVAGIHLCDSTYITRLGPNCRQTAELLLLEQDRLYKLFLIEVLRGLEQIVIQQSEFLSAMNTVEVKETTINNTKTKQAVILIDLCKACLLALSKHYQHHVTEVMQSQNIQLTCAISKDRLLADPMHAVNVSQTGLPPRPTSSVTVLDHESGNDTSSNGRLCAEGSVKQWSFVHCKMYSIAEGIVESLSKMIMNV